MNYNFHTHTKRCGHAENSEREYIERAIEGGIKRIGFSDHSPFAFPDGSETSHRVPMCQKKEYIDTLRALREEYKDRISISIGFEMEYYPQYFEDMLKTVMDCGAEYIILGQHFPQPENLGTPHAVAESTDEGLLSLYADTVVEGIRSGKFTYVAHPDVYNFIGDKEIYKREMRKICVASKLYDIPLEINFLGIRENRNYPNPIFWQIAGEVGAPITFGCDAHRAIDAYDPHSCRTAEGLVEKYNLNYIGEPEIILLQPKTV